MIKICEKRQRDSVRALDGDSQILSLKNSCRRRGTFSQTSRPLGIDSPCFQARPRSRPATAGSR